MPQFEYRSQVKGSASRVFEILTRPETILKINPPEMGLSFVKAPEQYGVGELIEFKLIQFGMVQDIIHRVTAFESPRMFSEEMIKGPLPKWIHTHHIIDLGGDEVELSDEIEFEPPTGLISFMVTESRIKQQLETAFDYRHMKLEKLI